MANCEDFDQTAHSVHSDLGLHCLFGHTGLSGSVGCAVRLVIRRLLVRPQSGQQHSFLEIDHEIFSTVILSLLLIQEGQLSVSG